MVGSAAVAGVAAAVGAAAAVGSDSVRRVPMTQALIDTMEGILNELW